MRFFAAFMVVMFHFGFRGFSADNLMHISYPLIAPLAQYGYLGVQLFFIISGFVIYMSAEGRKPLDFAVYRAIRLYPSFWVCCLITFLFAVTMGGSAFEVPLSRLLINLTMLADFFDIESVDGSYWSLYIEISFYFLVFLTLKFFGSKHLKNMLMIWLALAFVAYFHHIGGSLATLGRFRYTSFFVAGGFFYDIYRNGACKTSVAVISLCWVLSLLNSLRELEDLEFQYNLAYSPMALTWIISFFYISFFLVAIGRVQLTPAKWLALLGAMTYPLYLLHQRIGFLLFNTFAGRVHDGLLFVLVVLFMITASYIIAQFVERPLTEKLKNLARKKL